MSKFFVIQNKAFCIRQPGNIIIITANAFDP